MFSPINDGIGLPMKKWIAVFLVAACGSSSQQTPMRESELGTSTHTGANGETHADIAPPANDPGYEFRKSYQDPGGMWMPSQMTLPQHVDNFQKMGVKLDAKPLADEVTAGPAQRVTVVTAYHDVTQEMRDGLDKIKDPVARKDESEKRE